MEQQSREDMVCSLSFTVAASTQKVKQLLVYKVQKFLPYVLI
jgi:hypothetical protein